MPKNRYDSQIFRVDGKNCFFEVLNSAFPIRKVQMNFVEYDEKTKKQTKKIELYVDVKRALVLANDIITGEFAEIVKKAKAEGKFNGSPVNSYTSYFIDMGGVNEEKVKSNLEKYSKEYPWIKEGMALSRQFKIQVGTKYPWVLRGEVSPGESNETGLIVPKGKTETAINIPVTDEDFKAFANMINMHLHAYYAHVYNTYHKELFPNEKINVYKRSK